MSNIPTKYFKGTAQTVINTGTDIAANNFSGSPAATYDNTSDSAVPYAPFALAVAQFPDWAAAPVAGTVISLWGVLIDTDGTSDDTDAPSGTASNGARLFGTWVVSAVDALQRRSILIDTLGCDKIDFYVHNGTAQNMNNDAGTNCVVKITLVAVGVVA